MEKLVDSGKARGIGLSNFNVLKTRRILEIARIRPAFNQVELHPFFPQKELVEYSSKEGIVIVAHQPLGGRPVPVVRGHPEVPIPIEHPKIINAAYQHGIDAAHRGIPVVPKSVKEVHMKQNFAVSKLPSDLFELLDGASETVGKYRFLQPGLHLGFDIFDEENDQPVDNKAPWDG